MDLPAAVGPGSALAAGGDGALHFVVAAAVVVAEVFGGWAERSVYRGAKSPTNP